MTFDPYKSPLVPRVFCSQGHDWVLAYLDSAIALCERYPYVHGDWFRALAERNGVPTPTKSQAWTSGPAMLKKLGLIEPVDYTDATVPGSNILKLRRWKSLLYSADTAATEPFDPLNGKKSRRKSRKKPDAANSATWLVDQA